MLPNFLIIGAHKAGTSSIYVYIQEHPDVYMPELKEPRFFCYDEQNVAHVNKSRRVFPVRTLGEYQHLFIQGSSSIAVGEASPEYLNSHIAASRIRETMPEVKLIAGLRHPVERAYSLYQMGFRSGRITLEFPDWIKEQLAGNDYTRFSLFYYENLKRYYDNFSNDQIMIYLFDELKSDPLGVVKEIYDYLGVDKEFEPDISVKYNSGGMPKNKIIHKLFSVQKYKDVLKPMLPGFISRYGKKMYLKNLEKAPSLNPDLKSELNAVFKQDIIKLEMLVDRDLSSWLEEK